MTSQGEAKSFFVEKIVAQARADRHPLTETEEWMLRFSESDPEFVIEPARVTQFEAEVSPADYERRVARVLKRAYERDAKTDDRMRGPYVEAYRTLRNGDHYLVLMIEQALGPALQSSGAGLGRWTLLGRIGLFVALVVPGGLALFMAVGVAWVGFTEAGSTDEVVISVLAALFLGGAGSYLIYLWRRERSRQRRAA